MSSPQFTVVHALMPGQGMRLSLEAGASLVCLEGSFEVACPLRSLGGGLVGMRTPVHPGETWPIDDRSIVELRAGERGVRLACVRPAPRPSVRWLWAWGWRRLLGTPRRALGG